MTIKTLKPLWAVAARTPKQNTLDAKFVFDTRREARQVARTLNTDMNEPHRLPVFYVARFVHRHFSGADFTR